MRFRAPGQFVQAFQKLNSRAIFDGAFRRTLHKGFTWCCYPGMHR